MEIRRAILDPAQRQSLYRASGSFVDETLNPEIVHLVIEVEQWRMAGSTLPLPEEDLFAPQFTLGLLDGIQPSLDGALRHWREVEHILHLRHMQDLHPSTQVILRVLVHGYFPA